MHVDIFKRCSCFMIIQCRRAGTLLESSKILSPANPHGSVFNHSVYKGLENHCQAHRSLLLPTCALFSTGGVGGAERSARLLWDLEPDISSQSRDGGTEECVGRRAGQLGSFKFSLVSGKGALICATALCVGVNVRLNRLMLNWERVFYCWGSSVHSWTSLSSVDYFTSK